MNDTIKKIHEICQKYELPVFENPRDNVMVILAAAEPTGADKLEAFDLYDEYMLEQWHLGNV